MFDSKLTLSVYAGVEEPEDDPDAPAKSGTGEERTGPAQGDIHDVNEGEDGNESEIEIRDTMFTFEAFEMVSLHAVLSAPCLRRASPAAC